MDYREVLEQLRGYVQKPVSAEAGKICKTVRALNREQMAVLLTDSEKDIDSLEVQLQNSEYVIALKKELVKSDIDEILYQLGKFEGMTRIIAAAKTRQAEKARVQGAIRRILSKEKTTDILHYIYEHPNARHGEIAKAVSIKPNTLTYRMKELVDAGGVEMYASGKFKYYDLTLLGREYIENMETITTNTKMSDNNSRYILDRYYGKNKSWAFAGSKNLDKKIPLKERVPKIAKQETALV